MAKFPEPTEKLFNIDLIQKLEREEASLIKWSKIEPLSKTEQNRLTKVQSKLKAARKGQ